MRQLRERLYRRYNISLSKSGDDVQLMKLIGRSSPGAYVDVGCWHPTKASNTYYFYVRGWRGICIDPNPDLTTLYARDRPKDDFVNCGIARSAAMATYYMLDEVNSSMNTLDHGFLVDHDLTGHIERTLDIPIMSLREVLDDRVRPGEPLDFFDIDVEGRDLDVLESNDWSRHRPKVVVVETDLPLNDDVSSDTTTFLQRVHYRLVGKSIISGDLGNLFFVDDR